MLSSLIFTQFHENIRLVENSLNLHTVEGNFFNFYTVQQILRENTYKEAVSLFINPVFLRRPYMCTDGRSQT